MPDPSSGYVLTTIAVLLALALLWVLPGRRPGVMLAFGAGVLPALLIGWVLLDSHARLGDLQLNLTELHFAAEAPFADPVRSVPGRRISIGSNAAGLPEAPQVLAEQDSDAALERLNPLRSDDLVVRARSNSTTEFGGGFATLDLTPAADLGCSGRRLCLGFEQVALARGLIAVGSSLAFTGAIETPFGGASRLCVAGHTIGFNRSSNRLTIDGQPAAAPLPEAVDKRVILLRDFGVVDPLIPAKEQPLRDVASYLIGDGTNYRLIVADSAARYAADGSCATGAEIPQQSVRVGLPDDTRLWIYALEPTSPENFLQSLRKQSHAVSWLPQWLKYEFVEELPLARLSLRRQLQFRVDSAGLTVIPATPDTLRIAYSEQARRNLDANGVAGVSFGNLGTLLQGSNIEERQFASVGARLAGQFRQILDLKSIEPDTGGCQPGLTGGTIKPPERSETEHWLNAPQLGCAMYLGSASGDWAKVVQHSLGFGYMPFGLVLLTPIGLLLSLAGTWHLRRESNLAFTALILLDFMLAMRLLVAFEAAYVDPRPSLVFSLMGATLAILIVPPVAVWLAALFYHRPTLSRWPSVFQSFSVVLGLGVMAFMLVWVPETVSKTMHALAWIATAGLIVPALVAFRWSELPGCFLAKVMHFLANVLRFFRPKELSTETLLEDAPPNQAGWARCIWKRVRSAHLVWLFFGLAVVGFLVGFVLKRMPFPTFALLLYFGFAANAFIAWASPATTVPAELQEKNPVRTFLAKISAVMQGPLLIGLPLFVTSPAAVVQQDMGFLFLGIVSLALTWSVIWVLLLLARKGSRGWRHSLLPLGALLVLGGFIGLAVVSPLSSNAAKEPLTTEEAAQRLEDVVDTDHFTQRHLAFSNPEMMAALGSKEGEGARSAFYNMALYANQGLWGRGYLNQPPPIELRLAHTSDYAAAVHLMAPFGRAGTAGFLIVILFAIVNVSAAALRNGTLGELPVLTALGGLCLMLFGDLYMIMANLLAVPFTGRNVYWLSPISISDLLEGLVLIVPVIALALATPTKSTKKEST